jgi:hypothetical protein
LNIYLSIKEAVVQSGVDNYAEIDKLLDHFLKEIGAGRITK